MSAISGMTGFGRAEGAQSGAGGDWSWSVEARSVNGRNLDVKFRGPPGFDGLEAAAKAAAQARFARGQVTIGVQAKRAEAGAAGLIVNAEVLDRYLKLANDLVQGGAAPATAGGLLSLRGVLEIPEEVEDEAASVPVDVHGGAPVEHAAQVALEELAQRERNRFDVASQLVRGSVGPVGHLRGG